MSYSCLSLPTFWPVSTTINVYQKSKWRIELKKIFLITLWTRWRPEVIAHFRDFIGEQAALPTGYSTVLSKKEINSLLRPMHLKLLKTEVSSLLTTYCNSIISAWVPTGINFMAKRTTLRMASHSPADSSAGNLAMMFCQEWENLFSPWKAIDLITLPI